jgi:hypothetical protein
MPRGSKWRGKGAHPSMPFASEGPLSEEFYTAMALDNRMPRPDWMQDPLLLPKRPPGRP